MERKEEANCSYDEDEIFFGKITLKEVKRHIFMGIHQNNVSSLNYGKKEDLKGNDVKIIERSPEPNMLSVNYVDEIAEEKLKSIADPLFNRDKQLIPIKTTHAPDCLSTDSFNEQCNSNNCDNSNFDNILDLVDVIAQPNVNEKNIQMVKEGGNNYIFLNDNKASESKNLSDSIGCNEEKSHMIINKMKKNITSNITPSKPIKGKFDSKCSNIKHKDSNVLSTPVSNNPKKAPDVFKTPKMLKSNKKENVTKTSQLKAYEHIASPIAAYIKNSPQVPLVKDNPKKPLPSKSLIPKFFKNAPDSKNNKENVVLPQLAYRSAKKTLVIDVNKEKFPQSRLAQKFTTSSQKPVVLKDNQREGGRITLKAQQEDSFKDLSLHQADVSICTQKLAFTKL